MAKKPTAPPAPPQYDADTLRKLIARLEARLFDLRAFDFDAMKENRPPELEALQARIGDALRTAFGEKTARFWAFSDAADLLWSPPISFVEPVRYSLEKYKQEHRAKSASAAVKLKAAIDTLAEELADVSPSNTLSHGGPMPSEAIQSTLDPTVFIVHGHDEALKQSVARFIERAGLKAVILHEQVNRGRTIIEKLEAHSSTSFAIVLLTSDDEGRKKGDPELRPRARQNVITEMGLFMGKLGREKVCVLVAPGIELPSDYLGIAYVDLGGDWRAPLAKELDDAGFSIDWKKAMSG